MEIKYFRLVKTIAEEGNIANSSQQLFLTQSALSHQLKELEAQLGFKVFLRSRNKWLLTDEGTVLYKLSKDVLDKVEQGFNQLNQVRAGSKGTIRLSAECYSFYQGLAAFIQKMAVLYPDIEIDLNLDATHQPISKILSGELDVAIVSVKPENKSLISIELFEDEIFALMHKENKFNKLEFIEANHFEKSHFIIHSFPMETVFVHEQFLKPNNISPQKITAIPLTEVALEMVSANMGISCLPKWALKSFKLPDDIVLKKLGENGLKRMHYLVLRKDDKSKKYMHDFISSFEENFSQTLWLP